MEEKRYPVPEEKAGIRIDKFLASLEGALSRSQYHRLFHEEKITLEGKSCKANYILRGGEEILILLPDPVASTVKAQSIELDILYEDDSLLVVNKAAGMVVHPAAGNYEGTLVNALLGHCKKLAGIGGVERPGIVHRLDKETSGLLMVAKDDYTHGHLSRQLKERTIVRQYKALVRGRIRDLTGTLVSDIGRHPTDRKKMALRSTGGKRAVTTYRTIKRYKHYSFLELKLETGRTHQIRVHMASLGHPVAGDSLYGKGRDSLISRQALHAAHLGFVHPRSGEEMLFTADIPEDFQQALDRLEGEEE